MDSVVSPQKEEEHTVIIESDVTVDPYIIYETVTLLDTIFDECHKASLDAQDPMEIIKLRDRMADIDNLREELDNASKKAKERANKS